MRALWSGVTCAAFAAAFSCSPEAETPAACNTNRPCAEVDITVDCGAAASCQMWPSCCPKSDCADHVSADVAHCYLKALRDHTPGTYSVEDSTSGYCGQHDDVVIDDAGAILRAHRWFVDLDSNSNSDAPTTASRDFFDTCLAETNESALAACVRGALTSGDAPTDGTCLPLY